MTTKQKKSQKRERQKTTATEKKSSRRVLITSLIGGIITIIGLLASLVAFFPFISVSPADLATKKPFDTRFIVKNESPLAIYDVKYIYEFVEGSPHFTGQQNVYAGVSLVAPSIDSYTSASAYIDTRFFPEMGSPILNFWVDFRPAFCPFIRLKRGTRFFARLEDGAYRWYPAGSADRFKPGKLPKLNF